MKGDDKVIEYLNRGLRSELTAVNQYWLHFRLLNDWGYVKLAAYWRKESIEEMHHADRFVDRILFLDGFPNLQELDPLKIGQNVQEIIECDLAAEHEARSLYLEAAKYCESVNDRVSKILFEDLATDEEGHIDFLETQLELISQIGLQLYAQPIAVRNVGTGVCTYIVDLAGEHQLVFVFHVIERGTKRGGFAFPFQSRFNIMQPFGAGLFAFSGFKRSRFKISSS